MDFRRILSDVGISSIRAVVSIIAGLVTIPVITRWIGEDAYGVWATLLPAISLAAMVGGLHLHGALIRYTEGREKQVFSDIFLLSVLAAIGTSILIIIGVLGYGSIFGLRGIPRELLAPAILLIGLKIVSSFVFNYPRARQRVKRYEGLVTARIILETIVVVLVFWRTRSLAPAIWSLVVTTAVIDSALLASFRDDITLPDPSRFTTYLRYGVPMVPKEISGSLLHHADKFLIIYFLGPTATAVYAVSYSVTSLFPSISGVFNSTLYPNVTASWENEEFDQLEHFYTIFLRWYVIVVIPAIAGLIVLADAILRFISTATIAEQGAILIPILAVAFAFQGLEFSLTYPLAAANKTTKIAVITTVAVSLNIALNIALIPTIGILGAAIATLVAYGVRTVWLYHLTRSYLTIPIPWEGAIYSILATFGMLVVLFILPIQSLYFRLGLFPLIGAISFAVVFYLLGGVKNEEVEAVYKAFS